MQQHQEKQMKKNPDEQSQKKEDLQMELDQLMVNLKDMKQDEELQKQLKDEFLKLKSQDKNSIQMLKSLNVPPQIILQICCNLLVIFSPQSQNTWVECRKLLSRQDFIQMMINLDITSITNEQLEKLNSINEIDLNFAQKVSTTAAHFCTFLQTVVKVRKSQIYITNDRIKQIQVQLAKIGGQQIK